MDEHLGDGFEELPEGMVEGLRGVYRRKGLDEGRRGAILRAARREVLRRSVWRAGWVRGVAAGVMVLIGVGVSMMVEHGGRERGMAPEASAAYVRTGDIRDAYFVARELKAGVRMEGKWDANGDGVVDEKDVRALAVAAVKIERGGVQ